MDGNYNKILEKVSSISGIEQEEIERRVEAKRAKLSGLISREGALQVIAAELNISFDNEKLKIDELLPGMRKVNFSGKVITMYPIREYTTKSGDKGKVANIILADDTSNIKVVLWDTNHIGLLESGEVAEGTVIDIASGSMRDNEVHLGSFAEMKVSSETFDNVQTEKPVKEKTIEEYSPGETVKTRAFVVQAFDPRFFEVSTKTGRKVTEEELAEGVPTEKRAILNVVIDDGTDTIRAVMFHEIVQKIGVDAYDDNDMLLQQKQGIIGKEFNFVGTIKRNSYFNNYELGVNDVEEIDIDKLIASLEA
jgi:hypothetical protein